MNTDDALLDEFVDFLLRAKTKPEMASRLHAILTPAELRELPKRLKITRLLQEGLTQREVAKRLGVGIATVTRGAKALQEFPEKR